MNATIVTAAEKRGPIAAFMAKHVTESKTLSIQEPEGSDMNSPSIQTTKTHVALLIPKNMLWLMLLGGVVGGPSLATYLANRAGLVTQTEMKTAVSEAVAASQKATQESLHALIEDAVRKAVEKAVDPIDKRVRTIERKNPPKETTQ